MTGRSTVWPERVVAAYVLLVLRRHGLIDPATAKAAAVLFRLEASDARRAAERDTDLVRLSGLEVKPEPFEQPATSPAGPPPSTPRTTRRYRGYLNRREGVNGPERRCTRCGEWKPATEEHFGFKDRAARRLRSWCRPCWNNYQRERYLTRAQEEALDAAGVKFVLEEDQPLLSCAKCGRPLRAGDEVEGSTRLCHTACGDHP